MKILILNWRDINHEWAGGSEVYIFELAKRWIKMGHQVTLFCGQDYREDLPPEEIIDEIKIYRRGGRFSLYFWAIVYYFKKLRKECDFIVDVQNGIPFFSVLYSRKPKIGVVYHIHGKQFFIELPFPFNAIGYITEKFIFPILYKKIKIMAISETTRKGLIKLGFPRKNISIVYCGIDGKRNNINGFSKFSQPTILYLGRIKKYKRVDMLVKIMPQILKTIPRARLLIAGWGTEASAVADLSMRSMQRRRVKIIGPVSEYEKKLLLTKSWLFVNPSIGEGWGISVIEANLYGTPAIAFKVPGLSESIKNGKTGVLVRNEKELINKTIQILENKELRNKLSVGAKKWASSFNWDNAAKGAISLIEKTYKNNVKS